MEMRKLTLKYSFWWAAYNIYYVHVCCRVMHTFLHVRSTTDPYIGKDILSHTTTPHFLSPVNRNNDIIWIFMGAPGPGASMHVSAHITAHAVSMRAITT